MFNKWQLVLLGVVVFQGAGLNAMEKTDSPRGLKRSALTCSQEARVALKRSIEIRKEEKNNTVNLYYPWPGGNPDIHWDTNRYSFSDRMKPWFPH